MAGLRLAFMGTPDFSVPVLARLIEAGHEIACVYSQPPARAGRGKKLRPSPVHAFAESHAIEVRTPESLKDAETQQAFADLDLDAAIVVAYGLLLPKAILDAPKHGCFNVHASILPRWRGAAPIHRAIMAGDSESGVTIMKMDEGLDTGDMALIQTTPIEPHDTTAALHDRLSLMGADAMAKVLRQIELNELELTPQPSEGVTYAKKIDKAEARLDWADDAANIACKIRGLSPFPGAFTELEGERLKLLNATAVDASGAAGSILEWGPRLVIGCGTGAVQIHEAQRAGKSAMDAETLMRGLSLPLGTKLGG